MDKTLRIASIIRKNLLEIIQFEVANPHLGFISIPEVKVSSDYSYAKIYVSFFNEKDEKEGMAALNHSKGFIRTELAKRMDTRRVPELNFVVDKGYQNEEKIRKILENDEK
ncbi:MAG: 30S ribosome-binding factor RbfA [Coprobacillus sp.]|nr:30S ribosome-binding factor RbfA [Coprobacillus sp.]